MIVPADLLAGLQRLLMRLEADIRNRCETNGDIDARLRAEYERARSASRTAQAYEVWREDYITQVAVAWILGCVFVRFLEDNRLIDTVWLAGPDGRLQLARDQHEIYFQSNPTHGDREYLEHVFQEVARLPSMRELLDGSHNPISKLGPTGDGAHDLLEFWQKVDPSTGVIIHDFTDPEWNTRFLGDLYQDLSESARDRYALLQTPEFVEEFILDRTLTPAVEEFGYSTVKMIDPACGSGHFLLGGFRRLLDLRLRHEPGVGIRAQVEAALAQVFGVDVNPFAVAIARFRLLIAALKACGTTHLASAPAFQINVAAGDSLLHGPSPRGFVGVQRSLSDDPLQHYYEIEDAEQVRLLMSQRYQVVVGNPPYIAVQDSNLSAAYRRRYTTCYRNYQLSAPFIERFFDLGSKHDPESPGQAAYIGMIVSRAFMKKLFGRPLIEKYLPNKDLTHVIDTSGVDIPGHKTPTVILFARNREPSSSIVRVAKSIRSETGSTAIATKAPVWASIVSEIDHAGYVGKSVTVTDTPRSTFSRWPWSLDGGGAAELKALIDSAKVAVLKDRTIAVGRVAVLGEEDAWYIGRSRAHNTPTEPYNIDFVVGEQIRDWVVGQPSIVLFPYKSLGGDALQELTGPLNRRMWPNRELLRRRKIFKKTLEENDRHWFELLEYYPAKLRSPMSIAYGYIATHNHFVLDEGGKLFDRHGTVIKLRQHATAQEHFALLGLLNSSTSCFWLKQVSEPKSGWTEFWEARFEFDGSKLKDFPIPALSPVDLTQQIHEHASSRAALSPQRLYGTGLPDSTLLADSRLKAEAHLDAMVALQEELDWKCYRIYGITKDDYTCSRCAVPGIRFGERAFELVMARRMASGDIDANWFDRHGVIPKSDLPTHWPGDYREIVEKRMALIESDDTIQLLEQPEYKRRWITKPWDEQHLEALREWLLDRIERSDIWQRLQLTSCAQLADCIRNDPEFADLAARFRGRPDFEWTPLFAELLQPESVPLLSMLRFSPDGLRKHEVWKRVWELQRVEDRIHVTVQSDNEIPEFAKPGVVAKRTLAEVGDIAPPPHYEATDYQHPAYWQQRGKLDLPKERFVSFPFCERDVDQTPVIAWAGWDHLQQAQAIAAYYERAKNQEGWTPERRVPLLTAILELIPWLKQWHNDIHPEYKERMGNFFQQFVEDEARVMEMTIDQIRGWTPPAQSSSRRRKKRKT